MSLVTSRTLLCPTTCRLHCIAAAVPGKRKKSEKKKAGVGSAGGPVPSPPASSSHLLVQDSFLPSAEAAALRGVFDERFEDPRKTHEGRFVWDYWHVPNQYTLLRTPAADYFPEPAFAALEERLLAYGQQRLGCGNISPIWLSSYVSGCRQELHADLPHGPWAFVLSLTPPAPRAFTGGETMLLRPPVLDYWRAFDASAVVEADSLLTLVAPEFNRLTVFDARVPHGVRIVEGVQDPRLGRLVLHGWFLDPAPFFSGALDEEEATEPLNAVLEPLFERLGALPQASGMAAVALTFGASGARTSLEWLSDTLVVDPRAADEPEEARRMILEEIGASLAALEMPPSAGPTTLTIPFLFE